MSAFVDVMHRYSLPQLSNAKRVGIGVHGWLKTTSFYVQLESGDWALSGFDYEKFIQALSFDYQRFLFSSIESFVQKEEGTFGEKANAWRAIERYYAAFFAAHSMMRALGYSVSFFDSTEAADLSRWLAQFSPGLTISKGAYLIEYNYDVDARRILLKKADGNGGVHEQFWATFGRWMNDLEKKTSEDGLIFYSDFTSQTFDLAQILKGGGGQNYNWLSTMRNLINYKHAHGLWLIDQKKSGKYDFPHVSVINRHSENIDIRVKPKDDPLKAFDAACAFLVVIATELAQKLVDKSGKKSENLQQNWQKIAATHINFPVKV